jgi:hemoglobin
VSDPSDQGATAPSLTDLGDRRDIERLVRAFYARAFIDELLGPVFTDIAQMDLDAHLPAMCDFWETVLFRAGLYRRNTLAVHAGLHLKAHLNAEHFGRWLDLWTQTVDAEFAGAKAELAKIQAARIAWSISRRLLGESGSEYITLSRGQVRSDTNVDAPERHSALHTGDRLPSAAPQV